MAEVSIKGTVDRVFFDNKGFNVVEKFKTKTGEERSRRFTAWFTSPQTISAGDFVSIKGLLDSKIAEFTGKDGQQKQIVELSVNNAVLSGQGIPTPSAPFEPVEELPF